MNSNAKHVLIIEDEDSTREIISEIVMRMGLFPHAYAEPAEGLLALDQHTFHLALVDIMMPNMDGYQVLGEIRKHPVQSGLAVIFVTAKDMDAEALEGYKSGADYYITKPFTREQLEQGIRLYVK